MTEKEIKLQFTDHLKEFQELMGYKDNVRLYAMEMPVYTTDGTKYVDMLLEVEETETPMLNKLIVMEWKKGFIDLGAVEQCERYARTIQGQLYRKQDVVKIIASVGGLSMFELNMCREHNFHALRYDPISNYMELAI
jgi:hypothetical protein